MNIAKGGKAAKTVLLAQRVKEKPLSLVVRARVVRAGISSGSHTRRESSEFPSVERS